jgi:hypothetical protein
MKKSIPISASLVLALALPVLAENRTVVHTPTDGNAAEASTFITAKLIAIQDNQIQVRDNDGQQRTMVLQSQATVEPNLKPGAEVVLALRETESGTSVVSVKKSANTVKTGSSVTSAAPSAAGSARTVVVSSGPEAVPVEAQQAARSFEASVVEIAAQAAQAEQAFGRYMSTCSKLRTTVTTSNREQWSAAMDSSSSTGDDPCDTLLDTAAELGRHVRHELRSNEDIARGAGVLPGVIRQIRAAHGLDWDGWDH